MTQLREKCEHRARCGATGHYIENAHPVRCPCLTLEINKIRLGALYTEKPKAKTPLTDLMETNCLISGPLETIRQHAARAMLERVEKHQPWITMDAYRFLDIFLKQDTEYDTQAAVVDADLLIIMLGFGDPPNRYLPELIIQALSRRELIQSPTWVILGIQLEQVSHKYNMALQERLAQFKKVGVKS